MSVLIGAVGCLCLGLFKKVAFIFNCICIGKGELFNKFDFYDSMLPDITDSDRMDRVSAQGYAWGYIGSCIPFLLCLTLVLGSDIIGLSINTAMIISFAVIAIWWIIFSVPLLRIYRQRYYAEDSRFGIQSTFHNLWNSLKEIAANKQIFLFLLAFCFILTAYIQLLKWQQFTVLHWD